MNFKPFFQLNLLIALLFLLYPVVCGAEINASLGLRAEYDDNILLRADNEINDYRLIVSPALSLTQAQNNNIFALRYSSNLIYHDENPQQDTFSHYINLEGETNPAKKVSAGLIASDTYRFFLIDPRQIDQPVLTERLAEGNTLRVAPSLRFRLGSTGRAIFEYQYTNTFYKDFPQGIDSEGHRGTFSWVQELSPKVVVSLGYSFFTQQFEKNLPQQFVGASSYDNHRAQAGLGWQISTKIRADVSYAYVWREYDIGTKLEYSNWDAALSANLFKATELRTVYAKTFSEDIFGRTYDNQQTSLALTQGIGKNLSLSMGGTYQEQEYQVITDRTVKSWRANAGLRANIFSKLSLLLNGSYQNWDSEPSDIEQKLRTFEGTLSWRISEWLYVDIRYRLLKSQSGIITRQYTVNRYSFAINAAF